MADHTTDIEDLQENDATQLLRSLDQCVAHAQDVLSGAATSTHTDASLAKAMDRLGDQLLASAARLNEVHQLSEPLRRNAIDIAIEILKKLKLTVGDASVQDGMGLASNDAVDTVSELSTVALIYERVLSWGRGIDASIAQHPSVMAAILAVGQLGFIAKVESHRVAKLMRNGAMTNRLAAQIAAIPHAYKNTSARQVSTLLERIEGGIHTVLNRVQTIQGPSVGLGHTPNKELGSSMGAAPIAGLAMQLTGDGSNRDAAGKRTMEIMAAEEAAAQAIAARMQSQNAARARQQGEQAAPANPRPARGPQAAQQARQQQQRPAASSTTAPPVNPALLTAQQRAALMQRQAAIRAATAAHHDEHHDHSPQKINPALINPKLLQQIKTATSTAGVMGEPVQPGRGNANAMNTGVKPPATPNMKTNPPTQKPAASMSDEEKKKLAQQIPVPPPPSKGGRSI